MSTTRIAAGLLFAASTVHAATYTFDSYANGELEAVSGSPAQWAVQSTTSVKKYEVAAGIGLNGSKGIEIPTVSTEPDVTALAATPLDPASGKITLSAYFRKRADSSATNGNALQLGLAASRPGAFLNNSGAFISGRFIATSTEVFQLQTQTGNGSTATTTNHGSTFTLTNDNWYFLQVDLTRSATANTFIADLQLRNADSTGVLGTTVASATNLSVTTNNALYSDSTVFGGFRAADLNAVDRLDNVSISQVPEPTTIGLLAASGLLIGRRRRN
jgi:hypothetical protein